MRAAFTGTPGAGFDLYGPPSPGRGNRWLEMNLTGGGDRWSWRLSHDNRAPNRVVSLGVAPGF